MAYWVSKVWTLFSGFFPLSLGQPARNANAGQNDHATKKQAAG